MRSDDYNNPNSLAYKTRMTSDQNELELGYAPKEGQSKLQKMSSVSGNGDEGPMSEIDVINLHDENRKKIVAQETIERDNRLAKYAVADLYKEKEIEKDVFKSMKADQTLKDGMDLSEHTAGLYREAAKKMMAVNPEKGMKLLTEAQNLEAKAETIVEKNLRVLKAKEDMKGEEAYKITDATSLAEGIDNLGKLGIKIPPQYKVWNEETKAYFKKAGEFSDTHTKKVELELKTAQALRDTQKLELSTKAAEQRRQMADKLLAFKREALSNKTAKPLSDSAAYSYERELSSTIPEVGELDPNAKTLVTNDYNRRIAVHLHNGVTDIDEASALARDDIKTRFSDGVYTPFSTTQSATKASAFVEGKVYTDASGNKAKYSNGKWIPQ